VTWFRVFGSDWFRVFGSDWFRVFGSDWFRVFGSECVFPFFIFVAENGAQVFGVS
jgi:hypothetical protein